MSNFLSLVRGGGETTLSGNGQNQFRRPFQTDQLSISLCRSRQEIPTAEWQNNGLVQFDCRCWAMVSQLNGNQSKYTGHGRRVHIAGLIVCLFSIRVEKQNWYLLELLMLGYFLRQSIPDGSSSRAQYGSIPYKAQHGEANHVSTSRVYMACNSQQYSPPPPRGERTLSLTRDLSSPPRLPVYAHLMTSVQKSPSAASAFDKLEMRNDRFNNKKKTIGVQFVSLLADSL